MTTYAKHAKITVTVSGESWKEDHVAEVASGHAVARAEYQASYAGDLDGESTSWLQIAYVGGDFDSPETLIGPYIGYELVTGSLGDKTGSFVLAANGAHRDGKVTSEVSIVPDSGTGDLAGISGAGSYAMSGMEYTLALDYDIPE